MVEALVKLVMLQNGGTVFVFFFFSVKCDFLYLFLTRYLYELELIFQVNAQVFSKIMLRVAGSIAVEIFLT